MLLKRQQFNVPNSDAPDFVNQQWSWTNGSENLRMYLKNESILTLFKLKWMENK